MIISAIDTERAVKGLERFSRRTGDVIQMRGRETDEQRVLMERKRYEVGAAVWKVWFTVELEINDFTLPGLVCTDSR